MTSSRNLSLFKDLPWKEKRYFFYEELFDGDRYMKRFLILITVFITVGEIIKLMLTLSDKPEETQNLEKFLVPSLIVFGLIFCFASHLKPFERKDTKTVLMRLSVLCFGNACLWVGVFLNVRAFLRNTVQNNDPKTWFEAIYYVSKGISITVLGTMVNPLWQLKALVPLAYFAAIFSVYVDMELSQIGLAWAELITSTMWICALFAAQEYFRWRLFVNKSEKNDWNLIHESILNKVNNAIVVVDSEEKVLYSNKEFQDLSKNNPKEFFGKIGSLKRREDKSIDYEASMSLIYSPKEEVFDLSKTNFLGSTRSSKITFQRSQVEEISDVNELIQLAIQSIQEGHLIDGSYFTFDGKWKKENKSLVLGQQEQKLYEVTISPLGSRNKIIIIFHDTTHLARIVTLETNNQYKDKLLASVSHELRTPLNGNLALVETALNEEDVPKSVKENLLLPAYRSGKLLGHLINDILDYSQIKAEKLRMVFKNLSLKQTLLNCYQLLEIQAKAKKLNFLLEIAENVPESFITDHDRVSQIVLNLLSNSLKFTFSGKIVLKAQMLRDTQVEISVEDTGIGIQPEDQLKLFQEFVQIDGEKMKMNSKGVGLGLSIANQLSRRLGPVNNNGIMVDSVYGKGSCFHLVLESQKEMGDSQNLLFPKKYSDEPDSSYSLDCSKSATKIHDDSLPSITSCKSASKRPKIPSFKCLPSSQQPQIKDNKEGAMETTTPSKNISKKVKKGIVLIVDDEPFNIFALQSLLKDSEFIVESAFNGKEAVEKVIQKSKSKSQDGLKYQIIFMDCQMPIMDGFEATEQLCKLMKKEISYIPIVGCTAFTSKSKMDDCIKSGMKDVMNKPISKKGIEEMLDKYVKVQGNLQEGAKL